MDLDVTIVLNSISHSGMCQVSSFEQILAQTLRTVPRMDHHFVHLKCIFSLWK